VSEPKPRPFEISKSAVWEAYRRVKANKGAAGVDEQSIEDFERDLSGNLFKLWNRLSSGSYFPPPVRAVELPKKDGSVRMLGVPTVADRIAFDTVPWNLVLKAVAHHTDQRWILLYVERWLEAPLQREDGTLVQRDRGTPQGSAISPLLANVFMH
jgi:RNA-directed DNA polymerase